MISVHKKPFMSARLNGGLGMLGMLLKIPSSYFRMGLTMTNMATENGIIMLQILVMMDMNHHHNNRSQDPLTIILKGPWNLNANP